MFAVVGWCRLGRLALPLRARIWAASILAAALCVVVPADAFGQTTGSATIWSFLGVPNPFGINAADQQSANPAIQAAAKAKAAKHEICKKKKAIAYLAGLGCTPEHPEVGPALIAAMSDPDEPVRYEAVKAVLQTAGDCQSTKQKREAKKAQSHSDRCHDLKKKIDKAFCDCIDRLCGPMRLSGTGGRVIFRSVGAQRHRERPNATHELGRPPGHRTRVHRVKRQVRRRCGCFYHFFEAPDSGKRVQKIQQ